MFWNFIHLKIKWGWLNEGGREGFEVCSRMRGYKKGFHSSVSHEREDLDNAGQLISSRSYEAQKMIEGRNVGRINGQAVKRCSLKMNGEVSRVVVKFPGFPVRPSLLLNVGRGRDWYGMRSGVNNLLRFGRNTDVRALNGGIDERHFTGRIVLLASR